MVLSYSREGRCNLQVVYGVLEPPAPPVPLTAADPVGEAVIAVAAPVPVTLAPGKLLALILAMECRLGLTRANGSAVGKDRRVNTFTTSL